MPKETFFNLPDKKREMIENAAIEEFSAHGYDNASINRIVEACKIAKGSFYQYFDDKKDLLMHIMNTSSQKKVAYLSPLLDKLTDLDFFELTRELWIAGLKFAQENQKLALLGTEIMKNHNRGIYKEILDSTGSAASDFYKGMIIKAIAKEELRDDLNIDYITYMFTALNITTVEYYFNQVLNEDVQFSKMNEDMMESVDLFIEFFKNGIAKKS